MLSDISTKTNTKNKTEFRLLFNKNYFKILILGSS